MSKAINIFSTILFIGCLSVLAYSTTIDTSDNMARTNWETFKDNASPGRITPMPEFKFYEQIPLSPWPIHLMAPDHTATEIPLNKAKGTN